MYATLNAGQAIGGQAHGICYAIEGNVVDRVSKKNGKGWCEDVSPTLNTQDRHAICFQLCGDRDNPSVSVSDIAYCIPANPMSDRGQSVCIAIEGNGSRPSHMGKGFSEDGSMYTLNTIEQHSVCYAVENHPNDSRARIDPDGIVQTLSSRMGTGGNNTPFVLIKNNSTQVLNSSGDGIAATLDSSYYKGQGLRQGIEREYVVIVDGSISE